MPQLSDGQVEITLAAVKMTLVPTLKAMTAISGRFGGMRKVIELLGDRDLTTAALVLQIGLDLNDRDARTFGGGKGLNELIWQESAREPGAYMALLGDLLIYCAVLENGGRPRTDLIGEGGDKDDAAAAEGN